MATVIGPAEIRVKIVPEGRVPAEAPTSAAVREAETKKTEEAVHKVGAARAAVGGASAVAAASGAGMSLSGVAATGAAVAGTVAATVITFETLVPAVTSVLKELAPGIITTQIDDAFQALADKFTTSRTAIEAAVPAGATAIDIFAARARLGAGPRTAEEELRTFTTEFRVNQKLAEFEANQSRDIANETRQRVTGLVKEAVFGSLGK